MHQSLHPHPPHLRPLPATGPDLDRVDTRCTRVNMAAINIMHLIAGEDVEPIRPGPERNESWERNTDGRILMNT